MNGIPPNLLAAESPPPDALAELATLAENLDLLWLVVATALVALMQAGFLCLEAGLTRAKDSINVAVKNTADFAVSVTLFWLVGFGAMFGASAFGIVGTGAFGPSLSDPHTAAFFAFQAVFCGAAATIVSGACAGRTRFPVYLTVAAGLGAAIYPLVGHWAWGGAIDLGGPGGDEPGWLAALGFVDFAGSTVVHSVGGWAALATIAAVGPRRGRFGWRRPAPGRAGGAGHVPRPSNPTLAHLGALLLLVGWFGFNAGSTLGADSAVGSIAANTLLAACAGAIGAGLTAFFRDHLRALRAGRSDVWTVDAVELLNGLLGGLVAVTAGCAHLSPGGALLAGLAAGPLVVCGTHLLARLRLDDAVGAVPVHAFCGAWGTLAVPLLASSEVVAETGLSRGGWLAVQATGVLACATFTLGSIYPALRLLKCVTPLRVNAAAEAAGLNASEHGAKTDLWELVQAMEPHRRGESLRPVPVEPYSEAAPVAEQYNRVLQAFDASRTKARVGAARVEAILAGSTEPIVAADGAGRIVEFNPAAERTFGRRRDQTLGRNLGVLFPEEERLRVGSALRKVIRAGAKANQSARIEAVARRADGATFPAEIAAKLAAVITRVGRRSDDVAEVLTLFIQDVSARREAEDRRRAQLAAEAADRAKSQFLAQMSHEIRTPLNAMVGFADLLLEGADEDPEQRRDHLEAIRRSGEHLTGLVGDVLDLSRIEAGKAEVCRQRCVPHEVLAGVVSMLRVRAGEKGLDLDFAWDGPVPESVWTDTGRLRQIVVNLVGNALKFTARGGVRVTAALRMPADGAGSSAPARLRIDVADTGSGIGPEDLERVFKPFEQTAEGKSAVGGTGLGLAISREFAALLGGSLTAASERGRGSTFTLEIDAGPADRLTLLEQPRDTPAAGDLSRPSHAAAGASPGGARRKFTRLPDCRILVADDGEANRKLLDLALRRAGAEVLCVPDGRAAVDALFPPDGSPAPVFHAALMDVQMPVLDGLGATRELRRRGYDGPVLAVTAQALAGDRERCEAAGCTGHVPKPLDLHALLDRLAALLGGSPSYQPDAQASAVGAAVGRDDAPPELALRVGSERSATESDDEPPADFDPDLLELRDGYRAELRRDAAALTAAHAAGARAEVARLAHKIAGSAGTFGFPRSSAAAKALESAAESPSADAEALNALVDALAAALPRNPALKVSRQTE
ncbi:ATP-binding protein [Alienimonas californiensis]|uniref:histidine kinase n=1 Tax=Alienimonas californiensis TaxID=2527989 RepID=A0A517P648_9PLAN|nr:ATP-binding protein [Alienimonas californiensis]QDT14854.1 Autoinducer 2 sensor kinase/phosphatase LuxQ [Alienimonas californiensis]